MKSLTNNVIKLILTTLFGFLLILFTSQVIAKPESQVFIDVYGTDKITPELVKNQFADDLNNISEIFSNSYLLPSGSELKRVKTLGRKITLNLKKMGDFAYLNFFFNKEPGGKNIYFIVDVVDKKNSSRLDNFLPKPTKSFPDPDNLFSLWEGYLETGYMKIISEKLSRINYKKCPAYFCAFGFEAPEFKKYKNIFATQVPTNKDKLIEILREDRDSDNRANAAFLLAHIKDGNELIKILLPAMRDSSSKVRSNVMTVLGYALMQLKTADFPVQNAIDALDFPDYEDRKQALWLLSIISDQSRYVKFIKEHAKEQLLVQLKMQKPDIHTNAYQILKKISGHKFGERDYAAWKNWLNTTKTS